MASTCTKLPHIAARGCLVLRYSPGVFQCKANREAFSTSSTKEADKKYKLVIVGGGTGGSAIAHKFSSKLGRGEVAVVEPSEVHYYQPMFTLVGGGIKKFDQTHNTTASVLPSTCDWIKQRVTEFDPENNAITIDNGDKLQYDYLLVALGIQLDYGRIKGAVDALENDPRVCSNFHPTYVQKTIAAAREFKGGNAIFTFPNTTIKCAGAPQKIAYLLEQFFSKRGIREKTNVMYNTSLPVIFGIPRYAERLLAIVKERNIQVNFRHNLVEVDPDKSEAVFEHLDNPGEMRTFKYDMLHIAPPCTAPEPLKGSPLADDSGFMAIERGSMQHVTYPNVFGIGDCTNAPTAKTAAAVAGQVGIVTRNMNRVMAGKGQDLDHSYNGYTSCPLVVSYNKCIMAEFGYDGKILETFPINQGKPRYTMFLMKVHMMPILYWLALVRGMWHGPRLFRKIMRLGRE